MVHVLDGKFEYFISLSALDSKVEPSPLLMSIEAKTYLKPQFLKYGSESVEIHILNCNTISLYRSYAALFVPFFAASEIPRIKIARDDDVSEIKSVSLRVHLHQLFHCKLANH